MKLEKPLAFFDLETTGTNTATDRIVQIAITKVNLDGSVTEKVKLINPTIAIPIGASEVHGITDEMVKDAPTFKSIAKALHEELKGCDLGGFNSDSFDVPLLIEEFKRAGIEFPDENLSLLDVLKLERILHGNTLSEVYKRYTGEELEGAHDAGADTRATKAILAYQLIELSELIEGEITVKRLDEFCQGERKRFDFAGKTYIKENVVYWSFGKNMDKPVLEDRGYLNWVLSSDFPNDTKNKLKGLIIKQP